jgi:hypothetical protein
MRGFSTPKPQQLNGEQLMSPEELSIAHTYSIDATQHSSC